MARQLFNSPEKQWIRRRLWLPALRAFRAASSTDIKYLTFAGPEGHDIELFTRTNRLIRVEDIRVWENDPHVANLLTKKYGPTLQIKQGDAFDLCQASKERGYFPFHVINLDYTSGLFHLEKPRWLPKKLQTAQEIIKSQRDHATSFLLFFAIAATADVDTELGKLFVHKAAFDLAKRLGRTEPLFNLTRDVPSTYPDTLAAVTPCILIRIGAENGFDTRCRGKAVYRPYRSRRTTILSFVLSFDYDQPALTLSSHQNATLLDQSIDQRQHEACELRLVDVNSLLSRKRLR